MERVIKSLIENHGTPFYLFDEKGFVDNYRELEDTFKKVYKKLKYTRNLLAHGMEVEDTLFMLVQKTIEFIALYVYTVARFVE